MTFASSNGIRYGIMLNYLETDHSCFTVACTDYYIRHVKFADKNGYAFMVSARRRPPATPCSTLT